MTEDFDAALLVVLIAFLAPILTIGYLFYRGARHVSKHPEYISKGVDTAVKLAPLALL